MVLQLDTPTARRMASPRCSRDAARFGNSTSPGGGDRHRVHHDGSHGNHMATVTDFIMTGVTGASPLSVRVASIFLHTSKPSTTCPRAGEWEGEGEGLG